MDPRHHLPQLGGLNSHHLHHQQGDSQEGGRMLLRGDLLFLRRQRHTKAEPKAFIQRLEGASVWLVGCSIPNTWTEFG